MGKDFFTCKKEKEKNMDKIKAFFAKDWTMEEKVLLSLTALFGGIILGILFAPVRSINCGNNSGNSGLSKEDMANMEGEEE
ncbi:MAG: hypothetical protein EOM40_11415 [Clostridia bacterium]|nr:hypothetical protein [Clostridia bacterium]NCC42913.1 hypothetical protein [Clostridia bacterium]